jgi:hypothetical protein
MKQQIWTILYRSEVRGGAAVERVLPFCVQNYDPQPYDGPILLFQPADRLTGRYRDSQYGWGKVADKLETCEVPGDHTTMFLDPNVQVMGEKLSASLRETWDSGSAKRHVPDRMPIAKTRAGSAI